MKNAIILHGMPSREEYIDPTTPSLSNAHWFPWLQKQLLVNSIIAQTPEIPDSYNPDYKIWKKEIERFDFTPETILVGHSCGGGFFVRFLSENKNLKVGKVVLIAPWIDPFRDDTTDFFDFEIDSDLANRTKGITIFDSDDDYDSIKESIRILQDKIPGINNKKFHNLGHFTQKSMGKLEFPELLELILK